MTAARPRPATKAQMRRAIEIAREAGLSAVTMPDGTTFHLTQAVDEAPQDDFVFDHEDTAQDRPDDIAA